MGATLILIPHDDAHAQHPLGLPLECPHLRPLQPGSRKQTNDTTDHTMPHEASVTDIASPPHQGALGEWH